MNKERKNRIIDVKEILGNAVDELEDIRAGEEMAMENIPENLQNSEKYALMEDAVDALEDAYGSVSDAIDSLDEILEM